MELSVISGCQYYADPCLYSGYVPLLSECGLISPCTAGYRAYMCHLLMIQNSIKRRRACASKVHKMQGVFFSLSGSVVGTSRLCHLPLLAH